jgi:hypothetical protein
MTTPGDNTYDPPILRWFNSDHLRDPDMRHIVAEFERMAHFIQRHTAPGAEQTTALRKLLEAKDATVRAFIELQELESA